MMLFRVTGLIAASIVTGVFLTQAADPVFSGPQPGEPATPFQVLGITGSDAGKERRLVDATSTSTNNHPVALVFIHTIERSLVPLLRVVDEYGALRTNQLRTELVFLTPDRLEGERRIKAAAGSLKLQSRVGLSLDGAEGPGNYGLNKECLMTLLTVSSNRVVHNFALVQPGIVDAPKILAALASVSGDTNTPTVEQLTQRHAKRNGTGQGREGGMRLHSSTNTSETKGKDPFPGAVPTDGKLQGLLRSFIRPTNDEMTADKVLAEVKAHIQGNPELQKQALDGWTRVLHFGDRYGTPYSRKIGREFLESLQKQAPRPAP